MSETQTPKTLSLDKVLASVQVTHAQGAQLLTALAQNLRDTSPDVTTAFYAGAESLLQSVETKPAPESTSFHTRGSRGKDDD